jgi:hypothetical protein
MRTNAIIEWLFLNAVGAMRRTFRSPAQIYLNPKE